MLVKRNIAGFTTNASEMRLFTKSLSEEKMKILNKKLSIIILTHDEKNREEEGESPSQIWDMGKVFNINLKILDSTFRLNISQNKKTTRCKKSFSVER